MNIAKKNGAALLIVLIVMFAMGLTLSGLLTYAMHTYRMAQRNVYREQALYVAEAGVEIASSYVEQNSAYITSSYSDNGTLGNGTYSYVISNVAYNVYNIYAEGTVDTITRAITLYGVRTATYAQFSLWSRANGSIYFTAGEEFGAVHADDSLYFSCSGTNGPVFWGKVTSASRYYYGDINYVDFKKGFSLETEKGSMADVDFYEMKTLSINNGYLLLGATTITFDGNDLLVTNDEAGWSQQRIEVDRDLILYVQDTQTTVTNTYYDRWHGRWVSYTSTEDDPGELTLTGGSLDGRLTLVTEGNIIIENDITYADNPLTDDLSSDDALGLISGSDVVISTSKYTEDDLELHASIMATGTLGSDGSFYVDSYTSGYWRGYINLLGGIIQDVRGPVGTFNSSTGGALTGYSKNYIYDDRFSTIPPPYFPALSGELTYERWEETS